MAKIDHGRFRRQKVYEPEIPAEFRQDGPVGSSKAELRTQADKAMAEYGRPVSTASAGRAKAEPPIVTEASSEPRDMLIECQCGHSAALHAAPAALIGRRLRCTKCAEEPFPF